MNEELIASAKLNFAHRGDYEGQVVMRLVAALSAAEARAVEAERQLAAAREFIARVGDGYYAAKDAPNVLDRFTDEARELIAALSDAPAPVIGDAKTVIGENNG